MSKAELSGCGEDEGVRGKNDSVLVTLASRRAGMAPRARADLLSLGSSLYMIYVTIQYLNDLIYILVSYLFSAYGTIE